MRLSLRFILPLAITLAAIAYAVVPLVDRLTLHWFVRDLDIRTQLITRTIQEPLADLVREGSRPKVLRYFERLIQDERLFAVGYCDPQHKLIYKTVTFPSSIGCTGRGENNAEVEGRVVNLDRGLVHVGDYALEADGKVYGRLVLVHDTIPASAANSTKMYFLVSSLRRCTKLMSCTSTRRP